jgi:acetyl-CoA acyltransferase
MGLTAENLQKQYGISREEQDDFSLRSHRNAIAAQENGHFDDEIIPVDVTVTSLSGGRPVTARTMVAKDEGPRADTTADALARLKPVFHAKGTVTAGNSSQTSDGAAVALVMSLAKAEELGPQAQGPLRQLCRRRRSAGDHGHRPVVAIPKALKMAGLTLDEIGVIELNEAFAVQALAVIREPASTWTRVNVNGGAVALGHPLGCTGAKLTATILREMERGNHRYGMVTMCIGGGQGAAGIFETDVERTHHHANWRFISD